MLLYLGVCLAAVCYVLLARYHRPQDSESFLPDIPRHAGRQMTALGYIEETGSQTFVIPEEDRQNIGIFGEIGSGKTSVMRMLIMQDIIRKTGFLLIDPHRDFSREVLSMIPEDMQDKVVYISLASIYQFERTVCINPLQTRTEHEKYIRTAGCIDNLKQYFTDGWGHRLETILRNMINLVMSTPDTFRFLDIISVLFDVNARNRALQKCPLPTVRNFWTNVFPRFAPEAAGAIYNKFDKIINTPPIAALFSSAESTVSIRDAIEGGKIVIVDLGSAATTDIIEFVGTLLINMFNLENKIRFDLGDSERTPFNIYIDEVHMFSAPVIRELLNSVRKYNMKVTVATQSVKVLDDDLARELDDLFRCMVMFRCDFDTARLLARNLPLEERQLAHLGFHRFAAFSQGVERISGIGMTRYIKTPSRWEEVARKSLQRYGKAVHADSFSSVKSSMMPKLSPLEYFLLNILYLEKREINHGELIAAGIAKFGVDEREVVRALINSLLSHYKFVVRSIDYREGWHQYDTSASFAITKKAIEAIYSRAYAGASAGSELHTGVISAIADRNTAQFHYCIPDLADTYGPRADLLVYEFQPLDDKGVTKQQMVNPVLWSENVTAVEVETDPMKHRGQIIINYEKSASRDMRVWFVVFSQKHKQYIIDALAEKNIAAESYDLIVVDPKSIDIQNDLRFCNVSESSGSIDGLNTDAGHALLQGIVDRPSLTASQVLACLGSIVREDGTLEGRPFDVVAKSAYAKTSDVKPDDTKPDDTKPDDTKPDDTKPDDTKPDDTKPDDTKPDDTKPDDTIAGKYANSNVVALKILLEDENFEGYDEICEELKRRSLGVRRNKNGGVTVYKL